MLGIIADTPNRLLRNLTFLASKLPRFTGGLDLQGALMKRRKFITSVITACLCLPVVHRGASANVSQRRQINDKRLRQLVEQLFKDTASARAVGLGYLAMHPETAADAVNRVHDFLVPACDDRECLTRQRREDFTCGRTVIIDGWVLARCEADLCAALVSLTLR